MIIVLDFDGTCVTHAYPGIGADIGAVPVLRRLVSCGHEIVLWTMRSGVPLDDAVEWFRLHGIPLRGINAHPSQKRWTESPKPYGELYIDDAALGSPTIVNRNISHRPFIDWPEVESMLAEIGLFDNEN